MNNINWIDCNLLWEDNYNLQYTGDMNDKQALEAWHKEYTRGKAEAESQTFTGRGLNKAGTLIQLEDGTVQLIGDVNAAGGTCGCCSDMRSNTLIVRYAVLWEG